MKVRIIGSGTSTGVPQIGCTCAVCTSADPKDNRLRASAIVETEDARILIDCSSYLCGRIRGTRIAFAYALLFCGTFVSRCP